MTAVTFEEFHERTPCHGPTRLAIFEALPKAEQDTLYRDLDSETFAQRFIAGLIDHPPAEGEVRVFVPMRVNAETALEFITPPRYFKALAGIEVPRPGMNVPCPLPGHEDSDPSCQVWAEPRKGWFCHACRVGGTIYDLGAAIWGLETRGAAFKEIKQRLELHFGLADESVQPPRVRSGEGSVPAAAPALQGAGVLSGLPPGQDARGSDAYISSSPGTGSA